MKIFLLSLNLIIISCLNLHAQTMVDKTTGNWTSFLHLESGFIYPAGNIRENLPIRQNVSSYYVDQNSNGFISSENNGFLLSLRYEYFNNKLNAGVSSGLRVTGFRTEISGYSSSRADYFYLRYSTVDTETKFARIKRMTEANNFISIPVELRFIPLRYERFRIFAKAGTEFSIFNLMKETHIEFQEEAMKVHESEILENVGVFSKNFYSTLYASIGLALGKENKTNYIIEAFLPSAFLSKNNFAFMEADYFEGFKFSIQFPVKRTN